MNNNPFAQVKQPQQITLEAPPAVLDIIELLAEDTALAITRPIDRVSHQLVLIADEQGADALAALADKVAKQQQATIKQHRVTLQPIDWVSQVQKDFPPFVVGPFYVHGAHAKEAKPRSRHALLIEAAAAFGTGEHETTAGCLLALVQEKRVRPKVEHILDMGCGTAILAVGAARLWKNGHITACDNDAVAVDVSRINLRANRVQRQSEAFVSDGYRAGRVRRRRYEIIVANILARPLMRMAKDAARSLAPGGTLILSGLLNSQEPMVLAAHRAQGLYLKRRIRRGRWSVLVLGR